ncbi:MAG TPA: tyrosine-type recombinase/integrase [Candidatus Acidoferrum sp.]|nr:tyrosine-type recombinase/integrase [Candidatus Acidoferrum sp.]
MRKSLRLRDWQRAQELVRQWEAEGQLNEKPKPLTVKEACDKFLVDAEARNLREPTLYKYRLLFRQLQEFAALQGLSFITEFDVDAARRFRASWPNKNIAARKKLEAFRAFFRFVHESGWIPTNPATPLKPPKITEPPTAPFTKEEVTSILEACDSYPDKANAIRLRALVLLLRYSGLRIRDAATLSRNRIQRDKLFLYTAKTGTPVYCPLPPFVMEALNAIPERTAYFFWTGNSTPKTAASVWQESLKRLFILAGVPDGHAHRFRDTFSVELLLAGVPIERVSILLGHQSVRITEKHYAPWVRERQEQLEADVRRTWQAPEPKRRVHGGYTEKRARVIPFKSNRRNGAGGGNRTNTICSIEFEPVNQVRGKHISIAMTTSGSYHAPVLNRPRIWFRDSGAQIREQLRNDKSSLVFPSVISSSFLPP